MRLRAVYKRLVPPVKDDRKADLTVPRYIALMQNCVIYKIQDVFIRNSHFNDLYVLIMSLEIAELKENIRQARSAKMKERNINVRDVTQADAVKFLKGGSVNGGKH